MNPQGRGHSEAEVFDTAPDPPDGWIYPGELDERTPWPFTNSSPCTRASP